LGALDILKKICALLFWSLCLTADAGSSVQLRSFFNCIRRQHRFGMGGWRGRSQFTGGQPSQPPIFSPAWDQVLFGVQLGGLWRNPTETPHHYPKQTLAVAIAVFPTSRNVNPHYATVFLPISLCEGLVARILRFTELQQQDGI